MTKAEYEADKKERENNKEKYPWFAYFQFGWHNITYLTDAEMKEAVEFYHLKLIGDKWERLGTQPITIMKRN